MRCIACGCTNERACPGGCSWVSHRPPKCSACFDRDGEPLEASVLDEDVYAALYGIPEQADLITPDGVAYGADRCPASPVPAAHMPIWISDTQGYCARCRCGFAA